MAGITNKTSKNIKETDVIAKKFLEEILKKRYFAGRCFGGGPGWQFGGRENRFFPGSGQALGREGENQ